MTIEEYKNIRWSERVTPYENIKTDSFEFLIGRQYSVRRENDAEMIIFDDKNNYHNFDFMLACKFKLIGENEDDKVNSPSHYTWLKDKCGIEVIDITRHLDFDLGNAIKYLLRSGHKQEEGMTDKEKQIEDLKKAVWYINDKIKTIENGYKQ